MHKKNTSKPSINSPLLDWDASGLPCSRQFDDIYFSKDNGLFESRHVFIQGNQLENRFADLQDYDVFTIAETGFGTGLNFLETWRCWLNFAPKNAQLHFISIEKFPLSRHQLEQALNLWPELNTLASELIERYPCPAEQRLNRLFLANGSIQLTLIFDDIKEAFDEISPVIYENPFNEPVQLGEKNITIDAWFLDGFSPAKNPEMWQPRLYQTMAHLSSRNNTTLATFTAAGHVRRGLQDAGFSINKVPGYGRKREMVIGQYTRKLDTSDGLTSDALNSEHQTSSDKKPLQAQHTSRQKPGKRYWHLMPATLSSLTNKPKTSETETSKPSAYHPIAIIGAGLAGCQTAYALAQKGIPTHLYDGEPAIAQGASGNPQGVLYTRFSHQQDALAQFNLAALRYADAFYEQGFYQSSGNRTGILHLAQSETTKTNQKKILNKYQGAETLIRDQDECQNKQSICSLLQHQGAFTALGGWLAPNKLCQNLINNRFITFIPNHRLVTLAQCKESKQWQLHFNNRVCASYSRVILANAHAAKETDLLNNLPIKAIRGQMSYCTLSDAQANYFNIKAPVCGEGYVAPSMKLTNGRCLSFGATFDLNSKDLSEKQADNVKNLAMLEHLLPGIALEQLPPEIKGRASFRCATTDYLPIIGPATTTKNGEIFKDYRKNKYTTIASYSDYHNGLYLNIGHGSRGLAYTPIAAELLTALITGTALPISSALYRHLHPGRFTIRNLMRNK